MKILLAIGTGSFIGGVLRYLLSQFIQGRVVQAFPLGTLVVNILGCLLIGLVFGFSERGQVSAEWRLFLATGILGGFTTFSAFSYETLTLFRDGQLFYAMAYISASVLLGIAATYAGFALVKVF
jgi:fluoride exporter